MAIAKDEPICLIIPPSPFLLDQRVFMSLGILKVAAVLEQQGYTVEVVDLSGIDNYELAIGDHARSSGAKIFGISATTPQMPATVRIYNAIRAAQPRSKIILGGPHVTLVHTAFRREISLGTSGRATETFARLTDLFDVVVAGDGEEAVLVAIGEGPPQVIDADDPRSDLFQTNEKLNRMPFPARHLVDVGSYHYTIEGVRALSLIAQLGCPFTCGFCGGRESPSLRRVRIRNTESITREMTEIYTNYGVTGFMFYDDELNVSPKMIELMSGIERLQHDLKTSFRLRGFIKAQLFTDDQARAMYRAGFRWILTGFESGSPRILENINKKSTREENCRCIEIAKRHGLKVKALMSIGHPGESKETVMQTHDWLLETQPDDFDVTIITTYPGTPYYDHAVPYPAEPDTWIYSYPVTGDRLYSYAVDYNEVADYYKGDPEGGYRSFVYTDHLTADELVSLRDFLERDIRTRLNIPFNPSAAAIRYEHSMGQSGTGLPSYILRRSK